MRRTVSWFLVLMMIFTCACANGETRSMRDILFSNLSKGNIHSVNANESIQTGAGVVLKLLGYVESPGGTYAVPQKGNVLLYALFEVQNKGKEVFKVDILFDQYSMRDGQELDATFDAALEGVFTFEAYLDKITDMLMVQMEPQGNAIAYIGYEVPSNWKKCNIRFVFDDGGYEFNLTKDNKVRIEDII